MSKDESPHPYIKLFSRMLGLFAEDPIDFKTTQFLIKARSKFEVFAERTAAKQKKPNKDIIALGGEAPLYDIYSIIVKLFARDREAGERVIKSMSPQCFIDADPFETNEELLKINRSLMILCNQAALKGRDMKWLFTVLDPEKKGALTYEEFTASIREILKLWITEEDCMEICKYIDVDNTEIIDFKNFCRIPFKEITSKVDDKRWYVNKCDFL